MRSIDRKRGLLLVVLYTAFRLPLLVAPLPGWYHAMHQTTTLDVAVRTAREGIFSGMLGFSYSGANLHGVIGAPVVMLGFDLRIIRIVMFVAGLCTLFLVARIIRWFGGDDTTVFMTLLLLVVTPHFVVFTGYSLPEPVTTVFATASVYAYLQYISTDGVYWGGLSALMAGLATLNHFWGGIATLTIFGFEAIVVVGLLASNEYSDARNRFRNHCGLAGMHLIALVPAGLLYLYYRTNGLTSSYGKYTFVESWEFLLSIDWLTDIGAYLIEYQPVTVIAGMLLLLVVRQNLRDDVNLFTVEGDDGRYISTPGFWIVWLVSGLSIPILFPQGAFIHEYYLWWTIVPSVGLVVLWASDDGPAWDIVPEDPYMTVRSGLLAVIVLTSALFAGAQVSRAYVGPTDDGGLFSEGPPVICWYQMCHEPPADSHERAVWMAFRTLYEEGDTVAMEENVTRFQRVMLRLSLNDVRRASTLAEVPSETDILLTKRPIPTPAEADWKQVREITTREGSTFIYMRRG